MNRSQLASTVYDADTYDDSPQYNWGAGFKVEDFAKEIDDHNGKLFGDLRQAICDRLGIGFQRSGCKWSFVVLLNGFLAVIPEHIWRDYLFYIIYQIYTRIGGTITNNVY